MLSLSGLTLQREGPDGPRAVICDLELRMAAGDRLALLGGNGSGKTTLLRHLAEPGVVPDRRVGLVCQDPDEQLFAATVAAEFGFGQPERDPGPWLDEFGLAALAEVDPRLLSAGEKQRLQLAIVLSHEPELLLLDEPGSLQDPLQRAWLERRLARWSGTLIWATQDRREARACTRALVLAGGRMVASGAAADVVESAAAAALWPDLPPRASVSPSPAEVAVQLEQVDLAFHRGGLKGLCCGIGRGERLGITGSNGCGKSTLLAVLAGLRPPERGRVRVAGRQLYPAGRQDLDHGLVALAPQFAEYLFAAGSVAGEARLSGLDPLAVLAGASLAPELADRAPQDLSGGERRRLALALALGARRPVVLLDEPTAALDASGRRAVLRQVDSLDAATTLIIASHDVAFLRACGCRVVELGAAGLVEQPV